MSKPADQGNGAQLEPWLSRVDALLGGTPEGHPSSALLSAHAAGDLSATERGAITAHLQGCNLCRELHAAARAGLDEAERIERGLALEAALRSPPGPPQATNAVHVPFLIAPPPAPRALAATACAEPAPAPADRRVLFDQPGVGRIVTFREAAAARLGLFAEQLAELSVELWLDGAVLSPLLVEPEVILFDLGPATSLPGRTLGLRLRRGEVTLAERSIIFVEEQR